MTPTTHAILVVAFGLLALAVAIGFIRLVAGPTLPDRVLALDMITISGVGMMSLAGVAFDTAVFLDIALVLVVAGFIGTATFAHFVEARARERGPHV